MTRFDPPPAPESGDLTDADPESAVGPNPGTPRRSRMARVGGIVVTGVMAVMLILFVTMVALRISGAEMIAVRTGSMVPHMNPGDLLISRKVDGRNVGVGDVVTFRATELGNQLVTHRIVEVTDEGYETQGDANDKPDSFITPPSDVLGNEWFVLPGIGRVTVFLASGLGTALLIGIPAAVFLGQTLLDKRNERRGALSSSGADDEDDRDQVDEALESPAPVPITPVPVPLTAPAPGGERDLPLVVARESLPPELADAFDSEWVAVSPVRTVGSGPASGGEAKMPTVEVSDSDVEQAVRELLESDSDARLEGG